MAVLTEELFRDRYLSPNEPELIAKSISARVKAFADLDASMYRMRTLTASIFVTFLIVISGFASARAASETIKVGVLHSLSGTMAISEAALKDALLMLIDEQNRKGGLLGKRLEAVVVDPASNWPLFAEKARELIEKEQVVAVFGCWTSNSRKFVEPVIRELNSVLFYPVQYEGREQSEYVFYTGATPNQQALPAIDYLINKGTKRWVLTGTDYVYPRTTNEIVESYLHSRGVAPEDILVQYSSFGQNDWRRAVSDIKTFGAAGKKTAVVSTVNGDANVHFYAELARQGVSAQEIPVMAFSVGEQELSKIDTALLAGHLASWNYFMSIDSPENENFIRTWREFTGDSERVTNDPMESHYLAFNMWMEAVKRAGVVDADKVREALIGVTVKNLSGSLSQMLPNHHITKPTLIGKIEPDGRFKIVYESSGLIAGEPW